MQVSDLIKGNVLNLVNVLPKGTKLLGIDLGTKTIGLAVSDPHLRVASAIKTLKRSKLKKNLPEISHIAREFYIGGIIIGLPINMDVPVPKISSPPGLRIDKSWPQPPPYLYVIAS